MYAPIVRFTLDGQEREVEGRLATRPSSWTVGQTVPILYDPVSGRSELGGWEAWGTPIGWSAGGAAAVAAGLFLRRHRWWARH